MKKILGLFILVGLSACQWETSHTASYQIEGIETYKGQSATELFNNNGAPNAIKQLNNGAVLWVYFTNYRPLGGGELISYNMPSQSGNATNCSVQVVLQNEIVSEIFSNCR